jgi:hypothetical protein
VVYNWDDIASQLPADGPRISRKRQGRRRRPPVLVPKDGKWGPLTRENMDRRTLASKKFDALVAQIRRDCGDTFGVNGTGTDTGLFSDTNLTAIQIALVESYAGCTVLLDAMTTQVLLGQEVNIADYCQLASTLVRIGARIGIRRKPRDVTITSLADYLEHPEEGERPDGSTRRPQATEAPEDDGEGA